MTRRRIIVGLVVAAAAGAFMDGMSRRAVGRDLMTDDGHRVLTDEQAGINVEAAPVEAAVSPLGCPESASTECGDGYFACCWVNEHGCPRAKCYEADHSDDHCIAGGDGATGCKVERQKEIEIEESPAHESD